MTPEVRRLDPCRQHRQGRPCDRTPSGAATTLVNVDPRSRQHSARHCALRARRSGMSRLRGQIRRDDDTSEDVQRLETAGNAVFSNRLKGATRFRSCLRLRPRCSTIDYARAATQSALRPSASLRRRQAPTPRAPASTDLPPATEPASRSAPAVHIVFQFSRGQTFPGGTEFLRGQQGTCTRLQSATPCSTSITPRVCRPRVVATPCRSYPV